jgi:TP901 family phage tail tape measure protein
MSLKIDRVQLQIIIDNDESRKRMGELEGDIKQYKNELAKMQKQGKEGTEEYIATLKKLQGAQKEYDGIIDKIGIAGLSMKELTQRQRELNAVMKNMDPRSDEYKKLQAQLVQLKTRMAELNSQSASTFKTMSGGLNLGKVADGFNKYFGVITAAVATFAGIGYSIKTIIDGSAKLSDSFADIQKTTGMTAKEVKELNSELGKIDTRTSREELRKIAVVAGQLGIQKSQVLAFTESIDKLNVALGDEFGGGAEQIADEMGKLRNVFIDVKTANVSQDLLHIGNALNVLGAEGAATSPVMADFANRIGGVGIPLGLTSGQVIGLSATLQELNVNTERGGTAMIKIIQKMTTDIPAFAKIAGLPIKDFKDLVNKDLYGAFIKVIEGANKLGTTSTSMAAIIESLGTEGAGASEVFLKLGQNTEMLSKKVGTATTALTETGSIMNEFALKNDNLAGKLEKLKKQLNSLANSPEVAEFLSGLVNYLSDLISKDNELKTVFKDLGTSIGSILTSIDELLTALGVFNEQTDKSIRFTQMLARTFEALVGGGWIKAFSLLLSDIKDVMIVVIDLTKEWGKMLYSLMTFDLTGIKKSFDQMGEIITGKSRKMGTDFAKAFTKSFSESLSNADFKNKVTGALTAAFGSLNLKMPKVDAPDFKADGKAKATKEVEDPRLILLEKLIVKTQELNRKAELELLSQNDREIQAITDKYADEIQIAEQGYKDGGALAMSFYNQQQTLIAAREKEIADKKIEQTERAEKAKLKVLEKYDQHNVAVLKAKLDELDKNFAEDLKLFEGNEALKLELTAAYQKKRQDLIESGIKNELKASTYGDKKAQINKDEQEKLATIQKYQDEGLISYQQFEIAKNNIAKAAQKERVQLIVDEIEQAKQMAEYLSNAVSGLKDMETTKVENAYEKENASLEKQKKAELDAAKKSISNKDKLSKAEQLINEKYAAKQTALTEDTEAQKKDIMKKYADFEFAAKVAQIGANTAVAIMKALADLGPIAGPIAGVLIGATGLIQIGIANQERAKVKGLEHGDFFAVTREQDGRNFNASYRPDQRGFISSPTVLVGEYNKPEYVVSSDKLRVPAVRKMIDIIDVTPKHQLKTIDFNSVIGNHKAIRGYESGGYFAGSAVSSTAQTTQQTVIAQSDARLTAALEQFNANIQKGITARVDYFDVTDRMTEMDAIKNKTTIKR